ncbi:MAG: LamG domain-containing protein [bacterium]|nr:LamG domain-containing protein [bacterium]
MHRFTLGRGRHPLAPTLATLSALVAAVPAAGQHPAGQPLLWYDFDDQLNPTGNAGTLGAAHDGELHGNASFVPFGSGHAVQFDGSNDWVIPRGPENAFDIGDTDFSIFVRFVTTTTTPPGCPSRIGALVWKQGIGGLPGVPNYAIGVRKETGLPIFAIKDLFGSVAALGPSMLNDGVAHELLAVRSGNRLTLHVDGILCATNTLPASFGSSNNNNDLVIGGRTLTGGGCTFLTDDFEGLIDEVCIWNYAIHESVGSNYCGALAVPNSTGLAALIVATGSTDVVSNDLTLSAVQLPPNRFGYFITGQNQGMSSPPGSQGVICLSLPSLGRFSSVAQIIQGPCGNLQVDLTSIPVTPTQAVQPGDTWNFQCWYRDNNPGPTSNFTDAVGVTFH